MIFYLGQAVEYKKYVNSKVLPAILVGYSTTGRPIISYRKENGEIALKEEVFKQDISYVRQESKDSPSGKELYLSPFCKVGYAGNVTIKIDESKLEEELDNINKLIEQ